jgi:hypothetical protein
MAGILAALSPAMTARFCGSGSVNPIPNDSEYSEQRSKSGLPGYRSENFSKIAPRMLE